MIILRELTTFYAKIYNDNAMITCIHVDRVSYGEAV